MQFRARLQLVIFRHLSSMLRISHSRLHRLHRLSIRYSLWQQPPRRVFEFLEEEEEDQFVQNPVRLDKIEGCVDFENVHFGYKEDQTIINDFTVHVKPGQKVAIVGPTGAGKTTIVKLLMRFYDVAAVLF